jgi:type IV secretion system protein VirB11
MLLSAFGPGIVRALHDDDIVEIMVNPDGQLWIERSSGGRRDGGIRFVGTQVERIIRLVASQAGKNVDVEGPIVSADMMIEEEGRIRFEGLLPPLVEGPCFAIRKHRRAALSLSSYAKAGLLDAAQLASLRAAIIARHNILVAGGTGTGKTTLANALLEEIAEQGDRLVLIEDTRELVCSAKDWVALRTRDQAVTMRDLVRSALRLRPDRIIVGEVRGGEALDLLKAWNTGHPGGVATIHANDLVGALIRLEQLALEATHHVARELVAEAVDIVILLTGRGRERRVSAIGRVQGVESDGRFRVEPAFPPPSDTGDRYALLV